MSREQLSKQDFDRAAFIGVFVRKNNSRSRCPVRELDGRFYDLLGREIDLNDYTKLKEAS